MTRSLESPPTPGQGAGNNNEPRGGSVESFPFQVERREAFLPLTHPTIGSQFPLASKGSLTHHASGPSVETRITLQPSAHEERRVEGVREVGRPPRQDWSECHRTRGGEHASAASRTGGAARGGVSRGGQATQGEVSRVLGLGSAQSRESEPPSGRSKLGSGD